MKNIIRNVHLLRDKLVEDVHKKPYMHDKLLSEVLCPLLQQFHLHRFQTLMVSGPDLLSRYDQIPKSRRIKSEENGGYSILGMMCGTFSKSHS